MTKLKEKFLEQYSFSTLRDAALTSLANGDFIVYNSTTQKWENKKQPRFGTDFYETTRDTLQAITGAAWQTYVELDFIVSGPDLLNKYRMNAHWIWNHSSISNDARFRVLLDGVQVGSIIQLEPQDSGTDQRIPDNILRYLSNLSIGGHTISLQVSPETSSQTIRVYQGTIEVWRVQ